MEHKKKQSASSSSLCHLFAPNNSSSSSSSSSSEIFSSIFRSSDIEKERKDDVRALVLKDKKYGNPDNLNRSGKLERSGVSSSKEESFMQSNQSGEPHYFSSSIYYGGRENYSPRTKPYETHQTVNSHDNDEEDDDASGSLSNCVSRGNWWKGSLYY